MEDEDVLEVKLMYCSNCHKLITDETYFSCLDNYLQVNYFDTEEENIFCSKDCFCEALTLTEIEDDIELSRRKWTLEKQLWGSKFKDQCDVCKEWDYCKDHNGKVLCRKCLQDVAKINKKVKTKQLSFQF